MNELVDINEDIINKIDSLDISVEKKSFLKMLLLEEFSHRDNNIHGVKTHKNARYEPLIEEYYKVKK